MRQTPDQERGGLATVSLTARVYAQIRDEIITCALPPGARISESELATRFRVSKTPIREALGELRAEGYVKTFPRSGYRVAAVTGADLEHLLDLRSIVEAGAAEAAARRIAETDIKRLERLANAAYDRAKPQSLRRFVRTNREFHLAIARAAGNPRVLDLVVRLLDELERYFYLGARGRDLNAEVHGDHHRLVDALRRRDPRAARRLMVEHNAMTRDGLMALLGKQVDAPPIAVQRPRRGRGVPSQGAS